MSKWLNLGLGFLIITLFALLVNPTPLQALRSISNTTEDDIVKRFEQIREQLQSEKKALTVATHELSVDLGEISRFQTEQKQSCRDARNILMEFRDAALKEHYPVVVFGQAYTQSQIREQIALNLAELKQLETNVDNVESSRRQCRTRLASMVCQGHRYDAVLATLPAKERLAKANEITQSIAMLEAEAERLADQTQGLVSESPVRRVRELLAEVKQTKYTDTLDVQLFFDRGLPNVCSTETPQTLTSRSVD